MLAAVAAAGIAIVMFRRSRASVQHAPYDVLETDGDFELREYPDLEVASARGDSDEAFRRLFRFISRRDIAMTTPVLIDRGASVTSFVMPPGEPVPEGADGDVTVGRREGGRVAALRFGGFMSRNRERQAIAQLRTILAERRIRAAGEPVVAYYDGPGIPPPFRRNEVMMRVE